MKQNRSTFIGWQGVILVLAVVLYGLLEPAYSAELQFRTDATVLLMQQPDPHAGAVTPDVGVHQYDLDAEVLLTAVPKPGYYFVYWMGDVSDPTEVSTIVYMDKPKVVVAVFARSEFEFTLEEMVVPGRGGGGLRRSAGDYSRRGYSGGGAKRPSSQSYSWPSPEPEEIPDEFPVPPSDEFPVPVPEPATVLLLGLGSLLFVGRRTKK